MTQPIRVVVANRPRLMRELVLEMSTEPASTPRAPTRKLCRAGTT